MPASWSRGHGGAPGGGSGTAPRPPGSAAARGGPGEGTVGALPHGPPTAWPLVPLPPTPPRPALLSHPQRGGDGEGPGPDQGQQVQQVVWGDSSSCVGEVAQHLGGQRQGSRGWQGHTWLQQRAQARLPANAHLQGRPVGPRSSPGPCPPPGPSRGAQVLPWTLPISRAVLWGPGSLPAPAHLQGRPVGPRPSPGPWPLAPGPGPPPDPTPSLCLPPGPSCGAGCSTRKAPPGPVQSRIPEASPAPARGGRDRPEVQRRSGGGHWRCPGTGTRGAARSRAGAAA